MIQIVWKIVSATTVGGGGGGGMIVIAFLFRCSIIGVRDRLHVSRTDGEDKLKL